VRNNHVPIGKITALANAVDIELSEALDFAAHPEETTPTKRTIPKPENTLALLVEVQRGDLTLDEAATELGISAHALQITYVQNEYRLFLLYSTLNAFKEGRISIEQACKALDVTKTQVYYLMRTYGVTKPKEPKKPKAPGRYTANKPNYEKLSLDVVADRTNVKKAAEKQGVSRRTLHRYVTKLIAPHKLNEMSHWPTTFRLAFAAELGGKAPKRVESWVEFAQKHGLVLQKKMKQPKPVVNWREVGRVRMMVAIFHGEVTLQEVATMRGGSEKALSDLFDGSLQPLRLRFSEAMTLPVSHQAALADLLLMQESHYRREL
jgi:hypothetical protein